SGRHELPVRGTDHAELWPRVDEARGPDLAGVAAVAVDDDERRGAGDANALGDLREQRTEGRVRDRDRTAERRVVRRDAEWKAREDDDLCRGALRRLAEDGAGEHVVGTAREVLAVLLERARGDRGHGAAAEGRRDLPPRQLGPRDEGHRQ